MNILFIHQHYYPELVGTGRRATEMCELLAKKGHSITVITSYPKRHYHLVQKDIIKYDEVHNGVKILRLNLFFAPKANSILRMLSYFEFFFVSLVKAIKLHKETDLCLSMTPLASGISGAILNRVFKLPHHFDVTDILPELGIVSGMLKNKFLIYILRKFELFVYKNTTTFSTVTESMGKYIQECLKTKNEIICAPDWIDIKFFKENEYKFKSEIIEKYNLAKKRIVLFEGNIGKLQNLGVFINVIKILNEKGIKDFVFVFIGDGIELENIKQLALKNNINQIIFTGRLQRDYIPSFLSISDILISNYLNHKHLEMYVPGKIYEYISANKPIVMGAKGECESLINNNNLGIAVEPSNPVEIAKTISKILKGEFKASGDNSILSEKYSSVNVISELNSFLISNYKK